MGSYLDIIKESVENSKYIHAIDDIPNNNLLSEAGLSRIIQQISEDKKDFAVITAYRSNYDKKQNIKRNRNLRSIFNNMKMGVYQLIGHWQECQEKDENGEPLKYDKCPKDKLVDSIERSYMVIRSNDISPEDFKKIIVSLTKKFNQDASVVSINGNIEVVGPDGTVYDRYKNVTMGKIAKAYSQHVKKINVPFVFECEIPSTNHGKRFFSENGILYPIDINIKEVREW
jgi:hypothetical protein